MGPKLTIQIIQQCFNMYLVQISVITKRIDQRIEMYYAIYEDNKDPDGTSIPSISTDSR